VGEVWGGACAGEGRLDLGYEGEVVFGGGGVGAFWGGGGLEGLS
jgi:hypothetical protein